MIRADIREQILNEGSGGTIGKTAAIALAWITSFIRPGCSRTSRAAVSNRWFIPESRTARVTPSLWQPASDARAL
jgi:hypothetical protein